MNFSQTLLWPLTLPFGAAVRLRARAYQNGIFRQRRVDGIVISVGNLTVGGTGKTPMVLWIAERLIAQGEKIGILTRGYRGHPSGSGATSDEAQLLGERLGDRVTMGVGANRWARARDLASRGVQWFILDDGFQHLQLARDVNIVLIDATSPFGGGHLLPAGRLREPPSALARADIIVITRSSHAPELEAVIRRESTSPIFYARTHLDSVCVWSGKYPGVEDRHARPRHFFVFCGIGNPTAFLADLKSAGFDVVGQRFFRDHHRYDERDVRRLEAAAGPAGAEALLCTEKDVFNLAGIVWQGIPIYYLRSSLQVQEADQLWQAIMRKVASRPRADYD
ncbi:MAG TPA: tetraacyldisaccharide 4'-kinase [Candidatus Acidoferrales bacterium]|nr:tetraacyldisaccharide 4'-kinase [Candidatus Acidoferrales bacterium]